MTTKQKDVLIVSVAILIFIFAVIGASYGLNQFIACMDEANDVWACLR